MESIREIVVPKSNKIEVTVPDNFIGKRIEVIALEMEEPSTEIKNISKRSFTIANVKVEGYKFNREEANER